MREIVPDVLAWSRRSEPHGYDFNGTFVRHRGGNVCVDPVEPSADAHALLAREGVAWIVLTNRNHVRAADVVRTLTGAPVLIHAADEAYARAQGATIDGALRAEQRIGPFLVVALPGKSPGEVALHWPERRLLVVGDAVIGNPPGRLSLLPDRVVDDPPGLRRSVRGLVALSLETLVLGDGVSIVSDAGERLRELSEEY
jgi:glyoxylase-like metal-dependent hydrolase (beta-lactamase superfamily II)